MAAAATGGKPHVLAVPIPGQGHVNPLMILCRQIAKHGIKVTFVNPQSIHDKILSAAKLSEKDDDDCDGNIVLETVPDGLTPAADPLELMETLTKTMPRTLTDLIERINGSNPKQKISCVIADLSFAWIFDIAEKMGAEPVGFSPPSLACLAMAYRSSKLVEEGTLDENGCLKNGDAVSLSDAVPAWRQDELPWRFSGNPESDKILFEMTKVYKQTSKAKWRLCNSCHELEPGATTLLQDHFPVGPLHLLDSDARKSPTSFYSEDASCLSWLDEKPDASVVYVSFGSTGVFSQQQLDELALGLEQSGRAFLWVTRPDLANGSRVVYPDGFLERVGERGKIVEWAPQNKVLSHHSVGCFMSHCGWNSTIEGVSRGVPFLCWPYFADQFHNMRYICDQWETGLRICLDEGGIRSRHEVKKKIEMVFDDSKIKENALKLKGMCSRSVSEGGSSYNNLMKFIDHLRK